MRFLCIADEETVRGFRLARVAGQAVNTPAQTAVAVAEALSHSDCGILILTEPVAAGARQQLDTIRLERDWPLIVEIPGPQGPVPGHKTLRQLVQEAVGIRLGQGEGP